MPRKPKTVSGIEAALPPPPEDPHDLFVTLHSGPALTANRFGINTPPYNGGVRISFAEQYDDTSPNVFRTAVLLSEWTTFQLWQILGQTEVVQRWAAAQPGGANYVDPADTGDTTDTTDGAEK